MCDFTAPNRTNLTARKGYERNGFTIKRHELDFKTFISMNKDYRSDIPSFKAMLGKVNL